jgi:glycosyltransferase involved in cell wall biosynthesis
MAPGNHNPATAQHACEPAEAGGVRRIAIVLDELRPGGGERVVVHLGSALRRRGFATLVVSLGPRGPLADDLVANAVDLVTLGSTRGFDVACLYRLVRTLQGFEPDIVHVHDRASLPYTVAAARLASRPAVLYTGHGLLYGEWEHPRRRYRWAAKRLAAVAAVSPEVAQRHAQYLGWKGSVDLVPNGVPDVTHQAGDRRAIRDALGLSDRVFAFLAVGNVRPEKAFDVLLEASARLPEPTSAEGWAVLVAGGLPEASYCRDLRERHAASGLGEKVRFLGFREDVADLYAASDAFVLSSRSEGLPMVVLEAMMAGLPVVATRVGGVAAAVDDGGVLVPPEEPEALAGAMRSLLDDREAAADLGRKARGRALAEYGVDRMADRYLEVYERVAAERRRSKG